MAKNQLVFLLADRIQKLKVSEAYDFALNLLNNYEKGGEESGGRERSEERGSLKWLQKMSRNLEHLGSTCQRVVTNYHTNY